MKTMKKTLISILSMILMLCMILSSFASCSKIKEKTIISYGDQKMSDAIYTYLCCIEKTNILYTVYGADREKTAASSLEDNAAIWSMQAEDGTTLAHTLRESVLTKMKLTLYFAALADELGFKMTDDVKKTMQAQLDEIASQFPDKKTFNETVGAYGVDYNILYDYYMLEGLASLGMYHLFGKDGSMKVSDDEARNDFKAKYSTISYIFINTKNKTYPNGKTVYLPDDEKEVKKALAEDIYQKALAGEDFSILAENNSEKKLNDSYTITFKAGGFGESAVEEKALSMKSGEIASIDADSGIFIIKKLPLDESYYDNDAESIINALEEEKKTKLIKKNEAGFVINNELIDSIDIASLTHAQ